MRLSRSEPNRGSRSHKLHPNAKQCDIARPFVGVMRHCPANRPGNVTLLDLIGSGLCHDGLVHPQLPGFLNSLAPYLTHYGYLAVALIVTVESFGPPLPGETIIIAASIYAGAGTLNIWAVLAVAFASAVVGDNIGFLIGRKGGRELIDRWGKYFGATPERFAKAEDFFTRNGRWIVVVSRFIEGLRQLNGIIAGTTGMPWRVFATFQVIGAAIWVGLWVTLGYKAGSHITTIYDAVAKVGYGLVGVVVVLIVVMVIRHRRRKGNTPSAEEPAAPETTTR